MFLYYILDRMQDGEPLCVNDIFYPNCKQAYELGDIEVDKIGLTKTDISFDDHPILIDSIELIINSLKI